MRARVRSSANGHRHEQGPVEAVLAGLDRRQTLQHLAYVHHQRGLLDVMQRLLETRLAQLTSAPPLQDHDELLTVPQVAELLQVSLARAYELTRNSLPAVKVGTRQVRVRRSDLDAYLARTG